MGGIIAVNSSVPNMVDYTNHFGGELYTLLWNKGLPDSTLGNTFAQVHNCLKSNQVLFEELPCFKITVQYGPLMGHRKTLIWTGNISIESFVANILTSQKRCKMVSMFYGEESNPIMFYYKHIRCHHWKHGPAGKCARLILAFAALECDQNQAVRNAMLNYLSSVIYNVYSIYL